MKYKQAKQYTIRGVPDSVDDLLRNHAVREGKSLNEATIDALAAGLGAGTQAVRFHDLDNLAGTWVADPEFDKALKDMDRIDPELWK
jgi:hypothetical protein